MRKIGPDTLRTLPFAGMLLGIVAIAALALAYWGNVTSRQHYLQSRNFRLLADVAEQAQTIMSDSQRIVGRSMTNALAARAANERPLDKKAVKQWADEIISDLQDNQHGRDEDDQKAESPADRRIAPMELGRGEPKLQPIVASFSEIAQEFKQYRSSVLGVGSGLRFEWTTADKRLPDVSFQLEAEVLFAGAFTQTRWERVFSTMALATPEGRIVFAAGPQAAELQASSVAALLPRVPDKDGPDLMRFASTITAEPVRIAGIDYRMFTQPCCRTDSLTRPVNSPTPGFVVIGLAEAEALRSLSLAVSPVLVLSGGAFVMACLVGWTFLKCSLMGAQQRLGRHDVINLLASGLFGVALATILLLTVNAYSRLSADVDTHLDHLASEVDEKFTGEIERAAHQLETMVGKVREDQCSKSDRPNACQGLADGLWSGRKNDAFSYPDPISFVMVNEAGKQVVKAGFSKAARTNVEQRPYYRYARTRDPLQLWSLPARPGPPDPGTERLCTDGCYLQYIWSWNTGRPQVVISMPTQIGRLPVATLSIPMHALLAPVLPPGFEFAVVDSGGIVQFHSDPQRNGVENLLLETDQNARLRSLLAARSEGTFNATYGGYPYRGYTQPTRIPGWSIVVFSAKQTTRTLVLEWFIVATLLAALYTIGWVLIMLLALLRGASWLWPDPLRRHWYMPLGCLAVAASAVWLAIAARQSVGVTAIAGLAIPLFTWAVVYVVLAVRPAGAGEVKQWTELCRNYRFAGTALFVLTAAVPAASFHALSFDRHIEAFVKERQIGLAHRIAAVAAVCKNVDKSDEHVVRYVDEDHDGKIGCVRSANVPPKHSGLGSYLHEAFEDYVPYFTSASVALRELMHQQSGDDTWFSHRSDDRTLALQLRAEEDPESRWQVVTALPAIVGWRRTGQGTSVVLVAVVALLLLVPVLGAAYFVITFLLRRVLLANVVEPIRRRLRIVTQVGQHLQIICDDPSWMAARVDDLYLLRVTPAASGSTTLVDIQREASEAPASQRIGISDFEASPDNPLLLRKKLEIVEAVMALPNQTVLLFTHRTSRELDAWIRERCESSQDRERWSRLLGRLRVTELPARSTTRAGERWKQYLRNLVQGWREELITRWQDWRAPLRWRARLVEREGQSHPKIDEIATDLQKSPAFVSGLLTRDQILEEIEESADPHYREIWERCNQDERVVLEHVGRHGLASAASRRVVRRLLAAGLLRKDPELRLMSESFRRFVLEPERRHEVAALELQAAPSLWDRLRVPLALSGTLALLFLVVTQREALDTTVSMALGVTTAVPTLVKITNLLAQLSMKGDAKANV